MKKNFLKTLTSFSEERSVGLNSETTNSEDLSENWISRLKVTPLATASALVFLTAMGTYVNYSFNLDKNRQEVAYLSLISQNTEKLAKNTYSIKSGDKTGFAELKEVKNQVTQLLKVIEDGGKINENDAAIDPINKEFKDKLELLNNKWKDNQFIYDNVLENADKLTGLKNGVIYAKSKNTAINELALAISKENDNASAKETANQLLILSLKITANIDILFDNNEYNLNSRYLLIKDLKVFNEKLNTLINGNESLAQSKSDNPRVIELTKKLIAEYDAYNKIIDQIVSNQLVLLNVQESAKLLRIAAKEIAQTADELNTSYLSQANTLKYNSYLSIILFLLSVTGIVLLGLIFKDKSEKAEKVAKIAQKNQTNEDAINDLINKMSPLDVGDFTQIVSVEDKFVARIAEKVDNTREIFGNIVRKIKDTSSSIKSSSDETDKTSRALLEASNEQYLAMGTSIENLGKVSTEMDDVAQTAWLAQEDALKSREVSVQGSNLVKDAIKKMTQIRETIQESSKKIKKSSESAQAITEVTGLIQNITKQIEILALNAAIQAASSGESGKEFTVVAEAVQTLANDSKEATNQILELVREVQKDIGSAVSSMEITTQQVVEGSKLNEEAGKALHEIENTSEQVALKIKEASEKIEARSSDMVNISIDMSTLQSKTEQTAEYIKIAAEQVEALKQISEQLEDSVHGYKVEE